MFTTLECRPYRHDEGGDGEEEEGQRKVVENEEEEIHDARIRMFRHEGKGHIDDEGKEEDHSGKHSALNEYAELRRRRREGGVKAE